MGVIAIVAALFLEQWRPLGDRKAVLLALSGWADWLELERRINPAAKSERLAGAPQLRA